MEDELEALASAPAVAPDVVETVDCKWAKEIGVNFFMRYSGPELSASSNEGEKKEEEKEGR